MSPTLVSEIVRDALLTAFWLSLPLLLLGLVVGLVVNLFQIATSLQDSAFSTLPRLVAFLAGILLLLPWMMSRAMAYTTHLIQELPRYAR